jgi:WD40 repeat protein
VAVEKPFVRAPDAEDKLQIGGLVVFERETGKLVRTLQYDGSAVYRLLFSHEGQKLVRLAFSGLVVWDLESGNETVRMKAGPGTGRELVSAGFREDGTLLVGGHVNYQPTVWEADTEDVVWQGSKRPDAAGMAVMSPDAQFVVEFEAYGKGSQNTARVYDLPTGEQRFQLDTPPVKDHQCRVTVSPDARRILTLCLKGPVTRGLQPWTGQQAWSLAPVEQTWTGSVWDAETGERQLEMHGASTVATYAFSPDGRYLAIGEANGTVRFWSLEHREELFGWRAWGERAKAPLMYSHLEFTPDSSTLSVADPSSSTLHSLRLTRVQSGLAEIGLDW